MEDSDPASMQTLAIHGNHALMPEHAHLTPIFASSTFTFDSAEQGMDRFSGKERGYIYSRFGNPTTAAAEELIAALEAFNLKEPDGKPLALKALLHSSGQAAMATMFMSNLSAGDTVVSNRSIYGGTFEFLNNFITQFGVHVIFTDMHELNFLEDTIRTNHSIKLLHLETPANPTMKCIDIEAVCKTGKAIQCKGEH